MKRIYRTPWVQSTLAWLLAAYLRATLATIRWRFEYDPAVERLREPGAGLIGCFWHGRIGLAVACRGLLRDKPRRVLISQSADGEFIAKVVERLSFPAIRGSSGRGDPDRLLRGFAASREVLRFMNDGGLVIITPDGPVGPAETLKMGAVMLARISRKPIVFMGLAARPALTLKSWDRTQIPLPFGRGSVVLDGPVMIEGPRKEDELEGVRSDWQARLRATQARAEAMVA